MKDKLRELAERWKDEYSGIAGAEIGMIHVTQCTCAAELLAILDAEGDGGSVPVGYADPLSMQGYTLGQYGDFCVGDKSSVRSVPLYDRPHPARSGVVSAEDVEERAREMYEAYRFDNKDSHMYSWRDQPFEPTKQHWRNKARAALEHFARRTP